MSKRGPYKMQASGLECPYCGMSNGCRPMGGKLADCEALTADDWRDMYWFIRYVQLPFIHRLIWRAEKRKEELNGIRNSDAVTPQI